MRADRKETRLFFQEVLKQARSKSLARRFPKFAARSNTIPDRRAAIMIIFSWREEGWYLLLTRRSDTLRHHRGEIAFPGGQSDGDESPVETALRETEEELAIEEACLEVVGDLPELSSSTGFTISPICALQVRPCRWRRHEPEVEEVFWMPLDFFLDSRTHEDDIQRYHRRGGENLIRWRLPGRNIYVWGVTADILQVFTLSWRKTLEDGFPTPQGI